MVSLERYQVTHGIEGNYGKAGQVNKGEPRSQATENTGEVMPQAVQSEDFTGHSTVCLGPQSLSHVHLCETPWTAACQAPLSMRVSRQEYLSGLPTPNPQIDPASVASPALAGGFFFPLCHPGSPTPQLGPQCSLWLPLCHLFIPPTVEDHLCMETRESRLSPPGILSGRQCPTASKPTSQGFPRGRLDSEGRQQIYQRTKQGGVRSISHSAWHTIGTQ